jgi:hypothetical protein
MIGDLVTCRISDRIDNSLETIQIYASSVRIKKPFTGTAPTSPEHTITTEFSRTARARLYFFLENTAKVYKSQFVGTYHEIWPINGNELNNHIHRMNKVFKRLNVKFCYVKEFQTRGAPHIHWYLTEEYSDNLWKKLGKAWHKIAGYGSIPHLNWHANDIHHKNGRDYKSLIPWEMKAAYPSKYLTKHAQKDIPEGYKNFGSFWGHSRSLKADVKMEISSQKVDEDYDKEDQIDYLTGEILENERQAYNQLYRTLGRYDEHRRGKKYSYFRNSARSTLVHGGAKIIDQITEYWRKEDGKNRSESDCSFLP